MSTKLHRWIDLTSALLGSHLGLTFAQLRDQVPGYAKGQSESVRRTFERDKDDLRALGVPIETSAPTTDNETRYKLPSTGFYLPYLAVVSDRGRSRPNRMDRYGYRALAECEFTDDELALLADAAQRAIALGDPVLATDARHAIGKLGVDVPTDLLSPTPGVVIAAGRALADPAVLEKLDDALLRRKQVTFTYSGIERNTSERRTVHPYGLAYTLGHWYLHAHDLAREGIRRFRVSRMSDLEVNPKAPGTRDFEIPSHFVLSDVARPVAPWQLGEETAFEARVRFRTENAAVLHARTLGFEDDTGVVTFTVRLRDRFYRWLLSFAGDAELVGPPDALREYQDLIARAIAAQEGA